MTRDLQKRPRTRMQAFCPSAAKRRCNATLHVAEDADTDGRTQTCPSEVVNCVMNVDFQFQFWNQLTAPED